jgi:uncharacterized protein
MVAVMKKLICTLFIFILAINVTVGADAKVYDNENLLTYSQAQMLDSRIEDIERVYDCEIIIHTEYFGNYATPEMCASAVLEDAGVTNGVVFYLAMGSRDWHVYTTGKSWNLFSSRAMDEIENKAVPYLSEGDYYTAFDRFLDVAGDVYSMDAEGKHYQPPKEIKDLIIAIVIAGALALVGALILIFSKKAQLTSVKFNHGAEGYQDDGSFELTNSRDVFLYKNVTRVAKPKSSSGSSFGGGGGGSRGGKF